MKLKFLKKAQRDMVRIHDFLALKSEAAAVKRHNKILEKIERLTHSPLIGYIEETRGRRTYRVLVVRPYHKVIYYVANETVTIVGIWDTRQDNEN